MSSQYPVEREFLVSRLKTEGPLNATGFLAALNYTLNQAIAAYALQDISEYFIGGIDDLLGPIPTKIINRDGLMGYHGVPQMPLLVYKAIGDEVSVVQDSDALVAKYCQGEWLVSSCSQTKVSWGEALTHEVLLSSRGQHSVHSQHSWRAFRRSCQWASCSLGLVVERFGWNVCAGLLTDRLRHAASYGRHHDFATEETGFLEFPDAWLISLISHCLYQNRAISKYCAYTFFHG